MVLKSVFARVIIDFMVKVAIGTGLGIIADMLIEVFRVPVLNDSGTFGNASISNFEIAGYGLSVAGVTAGIADLVVNRGVLSFTKDTLPFFLGFGIGIQQYESWIADKLGLRKFNPYTTVGGYIPQVLPAGTELPLLEGGGVSEDFYRPNVGRPIELPPLLAMS